MIKQLTRVVKQKTDDGFYEIEAPVGTEVWILPKTLDFKVYSRKGTTMECRLLCAQIDAVGFHFIPVELLDFTNIFKEN